jgi:hypothetical protein
MSRFMQGIVVFMLIGSGVFAQGTLSITTTGFGSGSSGIGTITITLSGGSPNTTYNGWAAIKDSNGVIVPGTESSGPITTDGSGNFTTGAIMVQLAPGKYKLCATARIPGTTPGLSDSELICVSE